MTTEPTNSAPTNSAPAPLALRDIPHPDYVHTETTPLLPHEPRDAAAWAERLFSARAMPRWVIAAMAVRQAVAPLLGIARGARDTFTTRERTTDEVLIASDERHLDFRCSMTVDRTTSSLRVTTAVRLHNRRGRLYFVPVRVAHPFVMRGLIRGARRSWAASAARSQRDQSGRAFQA